MTTPPSSPSGDDPAVVPAVTEAPAVAEAGPVAAAGPVTGAGAPPGEAAAVDAETTGAVVPDDEVPADEVSDHEVPADAVSDDGTTGDEVPDHEVPADAVSDDGTADDVAAGDPEVEEEAPPAAPAQEAAPDATSSGAAQTAPDAEEVPADALVEAPADVPEAELPADYAPVQIEPAQRVAPQPDAAGGSTPGGTGASVVEPAAETDAPASSPEHAPADAVPAEVSPPEPAPAVPSSQEASSEEPEPSTAPVAAPAVVAPPEPDPETVPQPQPQPAPAPGAGPEPVADAVAPVPVPVPVPVPTEEPAAVSAAVPAEVTPEVPVAPRARAPLTGRARLRSALHPRATRAQVFTGVLCMALGVGLVVQVRQNDQTDLTSLRESELISLLDDTGQRADRLQTEAGELTRTREDLVSSSDQLEAARQVADARLQVLGILAGTLPATGSGMIMTISGTGVKAETLLAAVQELRDAGAEAIQIGDVRIVASSYFLAGAAPGEVVIDGTTVRAPYQFTAIGDQDSLSTAMSFPGGVVDTVEGSNVGGTVVVTAESSVEVTALHSVTEPAYAQVPEPSADAGS